MFKEEGPLFCIALDIARSICRTKPLINSKMFATAIQLARVHMELEAKLAKEEEEGKEISPPSPPVVVIDD